MKLTIAQAMRYEGRTEGDLMATRRHILKFARKRFGEPPIRFAPRLESITDPDRLERMLDAIDEVSSWSAIPKGE